MDFRMGIGNDKERRGRAAEGMWYTGARLLPGGPMQARWFVRGDIDGFFGLAIDNLVQLLVIVSLCGGILGFDDQLLRDRVLPGAVLSILVGNLFYSWQAMRLARAEGRDDVCALPYGINTPSVFAYVFLVMLPVKLATGSPEAAWRAGLVGCLGSGIIETGGAFVAGWLRRHVPRAALLSTLAGIALTFISLVFLFRTYTHPVIGLATLAVVSLVYFGRLRFKGGIPGGLVAVVLGTLLGWIMGVAPVGTKPGAPGLHLPTLAVTDLFRELGRGNWLAWLTVIIPMGLFNVVGSLQNLESAEAAGDRYPTRPSLAANGIGTLVASLFGSCFPTTIYIGHPGWKALGARIGYSWLNGAVLTLAVLTGTLGWIAWAVPIEAGMAIVLWIGIVITAQAFQATPRTHAPAVVVGLLPGIAAWGALLVKDGARAAGAEFGSALGDKLAGVGLFPDGMFSLEQGFIFTAMLLAAAVVAIIEGRFRQAAGWFAAGGALTVTGIMHGWAWAPTNTVLSLRFGEMGTTAAGYFAAAFVCLVAPLVGDRVDEPGHGVPPTDEAATDGAGAELS